MQRNLRLDFCCQLLIALSGIDYTDLSYALVLCAFILPCHQKTNAVYVADAGCYPTVIVSFFPVNRTSSRLRYDTGHNRPRSAGLCSGSREGAEWSNLIIGIPFLVTND